MFLQNKYKFALLLLLIFSSNLVYGQVDKGFLKKNKVVKAEISYNEKHRYQIKLKKNQFAEFRLMQKGIDLMITTYNSKGEKAESFDLTSSLGEELITISSDVEGTYILEVQPFAKRKAEGKYTLEIKKISRKAKTPSEKVDQYLARWDSSVSPGLGVAIVKDGKIVHNKGYGMANLEHGIPINSSTVFEMASVSKQFAAFSILLLADEGKLSIDDDIRKYLPELADFGHKVTLRQMLHHTSGLRDSGVLLEAMGRRPDDIGTSGQFFNVAKRQKGLNFKPGEKFEYGNTGYSLLTEVVKKVSGMTFKEFTNKRIFKPLGMNNSSFPNDYRVVIPNKAESYQISRNGFTKSVLNSTVVGSTGLITTAKDLSKWAMNFEKPKVGNTKIIEQMKTRGVLNTGEKTNYGFGQSIEIYKGIETFAHGGTTAGFKTFLLRVPSQKLSVIVLANLPYINPLNAAYEIADFYLTDKVETENRKIKIDDVTFQSFVGDFEILNGIPYKVTKNKDKLFLQIFGGQKMLLKPFAEREFTFGSEGRKLRFEIGENGKVSEITLVEGHYGGLTLNGNRVSIPKLDASKVDLLEFTGTFYSEEIDAKFELIIENGQLIAKNLRNRVNLNPFDKDVFSGNAGFFLKAKFMRNKDSEVIGFKVSGVLLKDLNFRKVGRF